MGKERVFEPIKKKKLRTSGSVVFIPLKTTPMGFVHIGEIIPGVLRDIERRIKESHKNKKMSFESKAKEKKP